MGWNWEVLASCAEWGTWLPLGGGRDGATRWVNMMLTPHSPVLSVWKEQQQCVCHSV